MNFGERRRKLLRQACLREAELQRMKAIESGKAEAAAKAEAKRAAAEKQSA